MTRAIDVGKRVTVHDLDLACVDSLLDLAEQPGAGCDPFGDHVRHVGRAKEVADRRSQGFAERLVALLDHGLAEAPPGAPSCGRSPSW